MNKRKENPDKLEIKQKKGVWKRFVKVFGKCRLPWVWLILYLVVDVIFINVGISETDYTAQLFAGDTSAALLTKLIVLIVVQLLLSSLVVFTRALTSARINRNMRLVLLDKIMRLPMSFFKEDNPRDTIYRIVQNAVVIDSTIMLVLIPIFSALYTVVGVFGKVFTYDWRLSVILLVFIPMQILIAFVFGRLNFSVSKKETGVSARLTGQLSELVTNIPLAKAFAREKKETEKGEELTGRLYNLNISGSWLGQFKDLSESCVTLLQSLAIALIGLVMLRSETITTRSWISFFLFSGVFNNAVSQLMIYWNNLKIIQGNADRVLEIMDAPEEDQSGRACTDLRGNLKFSGVKFGYSDEKMVLSNVNCEFSDHQVNVLVGESGCGKTTLVNLLMRIYEPQEGTISVGGIDISQYALGEYRSQFVVVPQNPMLFSGTIRENLLYGNAAETESQLIDALKQAGAYEFVMKQKGGLDARLEEYGGNLSGGQKQRLALARALLSGAHYLILDEPTASMDSIATSELMEVLGRVGKERCMIVIAHSKQVLTMANRVVVIEDGAVSAQGTVEEAKKSSRFLRGFAGNEVKSDE